MQGFMSELPAQPVSQTAMADLERTGESLKPRAAWPPLPGQVAHDALSFWRAKVQSTIGWGDT